MIGRACFVLLVISLPLAAFPVPKPARTQSIADTSWNCDGIIGLATYTFNADGTLFYQQANNQVNKSGTWTQTGDKIYLEFNKKYCEFEGVVQGDEIRGRVWNVVNFRKDIVFNRVPAK